MAAATAPVLPGAPEGPPAAPPPRAATAGLGRVALVCLALTFLFTAATIALFQRAYPLVDVDLRLDRAGAIRQARALAATDQLAPAGARPAASFARDDSLATYVDLAAGGADAVRALARNGPVPLYVWAVRLYTPGATDEVTLRFTADGRPAGVDRTLPEAERRPTVDEPTGRAAAEAALARYAPPAAGAAGAWRFVASSYVTQPRGGRVDRTYRFDRVGADGAPLRVGAAPVRAAVTVTGDAVRPGAAAVLDVRVHAEVPEGWTRRYGEMRSANDLLALLASPPLLLFAVGAVAALVHGQRRGLVRWRPAAVVGGIVGVLMTASGLNQIPLGWMQYDTATSPATFVASNALGAVAGGAIAGLWVAVAIAAAELLTRRAFPRHYDWYAYPRHAGTAPVAGRLLGGYALAALGFLYVTTFYLSTRSALGWWVPTESLDDPNAIATPLPWVAALGTSLFAGTWEEAIFRAVPLALLSLWARDRRGRRWWLAAGVVVTALAFGFGHANYPSWPAYSRGVELFAEAALWAVLYLVVGLPTTIVAHVLYDLAWFGLFALHGSGPAYRTSAVVVLLAAALPALAVLVGWWRARAAGAALGAQVPRLGDWRPLHAAAELATDDLTSDGRTTDTLAADARTTRPMVPPLAGDGPHLGERSAPAAPAGAPTAGAAWTAAARTAAVTPRLRWVAGAVVALALGAALLAPPAAPAGPGYTAPRAAVARAADSALRARGVDPARWSRTLVTEEIGHPAERRFLRDTAGRVPAAALGRRLAGSYLIPAQWHARYVRRDGPPTARREEWSVLVYPDGRVRRVDHDVADDAPGASPTPAAARALAAAALRAGIAGPDAAVARLGETELAQQPRPRRLDTTIEYVDSATALPGGATARVVVRLAGDEAVRGGRIVRLPDAWTRRDADRQSRRSLAFGVSGLVVFAGLVALLVRGGRRAPVLPPVVTRRRAVLVGLAAGLVSLATSTNELAGVLAGWETQVPWSSFLGTTAVATVLGAAMAGLIAGVLWSGVDALRRRAGVPFFPASGRGGAAGAPAAARDALLLGAALGLAPVALQLLTPVLRTGAWPDAPTTTLDLMVPFAAQALRAVQSLAWAPAAALPVAALAAGIRTPRARLAALAAAALVLAVATAASSGGEVSGATGAASVVVGTALAALTVWAFGRRDALAWLAAPPAAAVVLGVAAARSAANATDAAAALAGAAAAAALLVALYRWAARTRADAGAQVA